LTPLYISSVVPHILSETITMRGDTNHSPKTASAPQTTSPFQQSVSSSDSQSLENDASKQDYNRNESAVYMEIPNIESSQLVFSHSRNIDRCYIADDVQLRHTPHKNSRAHDSFCTQADQYKRHNTVRKERQVLGQ